MVNVPITSDDLLQTFNEINSFPKQPLDAGLIPVKFKRKKEYKRSVLKSWINPDLCIKAVNYFRDQGHPSYQDINIINDYVPNVPMDNESSSEDESESLQEEIVQKSIPQQHSLSLNRSKAWGKKT